MEIVPVNARVHLIISGRVQGVYFRASTVQQARQLQISGWVMNCRDGSVEVVAEGPREKLDELIAWCRRGPPGARVMNVAVIWADAENDFHSFSIQR